MKSDVIRKRSRHDARRGSNAAATGAPSGEDNPPISPGTSQHASPVRDPSPTLAPDSTTALTYDYTQDPLIDTYGTSELVGALGQDPSTAANLFQHMYQYQYPGTYNSDYLFQMYATQVQAVGGGGSGADELGGGFGSPSVGVLDLTAPISTATAGSSTGTSGNETSPVSDPTMSPRSIKRRKMSIDSVSEPPSAVSSLSFGDAYSPSSSVPSSARSSMEFSYSSFATNTRNTAGVPPTGVGNDTSRSGSSGPALRGSGNTFWHPPMMLQNDDHPGSSPRLGFHPSSPTLNKNLTASIIPTSSSPSSSPSSSSINPGGKMRRGIDLPDRHMGRPSTSAEGGESEDSPMDYLHPPTLGVGGMGVVGPDDDSLFSAYLHPPMVVQSEDSPTSGGPIVV